MASRYSWCFEKSGSYDHTRYTLISIATGRDRSSSDESVSKMPKMALKLHTVSSSSQYGTLCFRIYYKKEPHEIRTWDVIRLDDGGRRLRR